MNSDTDAFFPHEIPFPEVKIDDFLRQAATDIITILTHPPPTTVPSLQAGDSTKNAILELASILNRADNISNKLENQRKVALTAAHQLRPSPSSATSPTIALPATPLCSYHWSRQASPVPKPPPALSTAQCQRLKTILTNFFTTLSNRSPPAPPPPTFQVPQSHSFKHRAATSLLPHHIFVNSLHVNHIYNSSGVKQSLRTLLKGNDKFIWFRSLSNEFGRLAQGNGFNIKGTDTIDFISPQDVPPDHPVTYASFVCDYRPLKEEKYRVRLVVGGDKLHYSDDAGSPTATLIETKLLINSVISGAKRTGCKIYDL